LIKGLLSKDFSTRYGCGPGGFNEIKLHAWFQDMDWQRLIRKEIVPDFIPDVMNCLKIERTEKLSSRGCFRRNLI
jgi:hypothetical protein